MMRGFFFSLSLILSLSFVPQLFAVSQLFADKLVLTDFNTGEKTSENVWDFGGWDRGQDFPNQSCVQSFEADQRYGETGLSLRLDYDVEDRAPAYNGFWMKLKDLDLSKSKYLNFCVKGDAQKGFPKVIKLELKNGTEVGRYLYTEVSGDWKQAKVALADFKGLKDWTTMTEFVIVFDDMNSKPKVGTLFVDEIAFTTE
ncbi:MAG: hypothetical protein HYS08_07070 [Chlamydiae bacterium]|nr:hypothetical protein [Chlamydiota bacterium]MBI3266423.1 hypothetical protein [Chlamydiota bacterium]